MKHVHNICEAKFKSAAFRLDDAIALALPDIFMNALMAVYGFRSFLVLRVSLRNVCLFSDAFYDRSHFISYLYLKKGAREKIHIFFACYLPFH